MNAWVVAWTVACIIVCALFGVGLLLGIHAATVDWLWQRAHARRAMDQAAAPEPDWAFLANCKWCANLSQDVTDCICEQACEGVSYCVAACERTATIAIPVIPEDS